MNKYLLQASYTQAGLTGLIAEGGAARRAALTATIEEVGGSVEALYYAFGACDLFIIADLPDDATATAVSLTIGAGGGAAVSVTVLITPETIDAAVAKSVPYRAPGA